MIEGKQAGPGEPRARRGGLWAIIALLIVAAIVVAGIVPRRRARAALRTETNDLAVPSVSVVHPKVVAPLSEITLPGNIQAFTDSPIYARTNGYLKKWYVDIGARVTAGQVRAEIAHPAA